VPLIHNGSLPEPVKEENQERPRWNQVQFTWKTDAKTDGADANIVNNHMPTQVIVCTTERKSNKTSF